ncbi:MAG: ferritin-like domain-containing protein [Candidatus Paracaedibacteraceae bacterium]|nr:ferritin-like domain-containing protein [Candidatus Paracaedibacteraceae bacterium]
MVTFVGTQSDFEEALKALVELEYDAAEAYEAGINRIENEEYKMKIISFMQDHLRHIKELTELLKTHDIIAPSGPSLGKQWITKGKVILGNLVGDGAILLALKSNEIDTNTAYNRLKNHEHIWPDAKETIARGLLDEHRHKKWLESILDSE